MRIAVWPPGRRKKQVDPYPPGFMALNNRVGKYSGAKGVACNFVSWLKEFVEVTGDWNGFCGFSLIQQRYPGNTPWRQNTKHNKKKSKKYSGRSMVSPWPTHCMTALSQAEIQAVWHSAQSLLTAKRWYQRIATKKLTVLVWSPFCGAKFPLNYKRR